MNAFLPVIAAAVTIMLLFLAASMFPPAPSSRCGASGDPFVAIGALPPHPCKGATK